MSFYHGNDLHYILGNVLSILPQKQQPNKKLNDLRAKLKILKRISERLFVLIFNYIWDAIEPVLIS